MLNRSLACLLAILTAVLSSACGDLSPATRLRHADELAAASGWQRIYLDAEPFRLAAYVPGRISSGSALTVYIEGDGLAFITRSQVSVVTSTNKAVDMLITVAGNLDHRAWTDYHHVPPLTASLNAADAWQSLAGLPQRHFLGSEDGTINRAVMVSYIARFPAGQRPQVRVIEGYDHHCCWARDWPALLAAEKLLR